MASHPPLNYVMALGPDLKNVSTPGLSYSTHMWKRQVNKLSQLFPVDVDGEARLKTRLYQMGLL